MNSVSMKEANCPSFIAAPFIWPSAPTIRIAVSRWSCSMCSWPDSSSRATLAARVPGVVYTGGEDARPFQVSERDLRTILISGQALFDLEIGEQSAVPVVIKE